MGAAWCRDRAARAHDSKSPIDRVFVTCVDRVYPRPKSPSRHVDPFDGDHHIRTYHITPSTPVAVHRALPSPATAPERPQKSFVVASSSWQAVELQVPRQKDVGRPATVASSPATPVDSGATSDDGASIGPTPVPPPRKKRHLRRTRPAAAAQQPLAPPQHRSVSTIVPPTIITDDGFLSVREQKLSTVSLPDYQQLENADRHLLRPRTASGGTSLTSVSEATVERLDSYMQRCRSFGSVNTGQLVEELVARSRSHTPTASPSSSSDDDSDDSWGMGGLDQPVVAPGEGPPLSPTHRLSGKRRKVGVAAPGTQQVAVPTTETTRDSPSAFFRNEETVQQEPTKESELREVKKELQSIIYDFNLYTGKDSTTRADLEILPTRPLTQERRKKISIKSITPPPSPEITDHEEESTEKPKNGEDTVKTEIVSKIINGYHKAISSSAQAADSDAEAEAVLRALGVPPSLQEGSRRSSMTPSLSELEAAISDLLEQTADNDADDEEGSTCSDARVNNITANGNGEKAKEDKSPENGTSAEFPSVTKHNNASKANTDSRLTAANEKDFQGNTVLGNIFGNTGHDAIEILDSVSNPVSFANNIADTDESKIVTESKVSLSQSNGEGGEKEERIRKACILPIISVHSEIS